MKIGIFKIMFLAVLLTFLNGCETEDCQTVDGVSCVGGGQIEACCTGDDCKYKLNGQEYPCNGSDCTAAAELVAGICVNGSAPASVTGIPTTEQHLLLEITNGLLLQQEIDRLSGEK